jgi:predicted alternative tryptophan synthase beta-subunit
MNPQLFIVKNRNSRDYTLRKSIRFAIIDSDTHKGYPSNFICMLPQHVNMNSEDTSVFAKTFGECRLDLAKKLLTEALQTENDMEIRKEIQERLKMLNPKPAWQARNRH